VSNFEVARQCDDIALMRCEGPFGLPSSQWVLTVQEAEQIIKFLGNAVKSMKQRSASPQEGRHE
jgi:hypothetical protein